MIKGLFAVAAVVVLLGGCGGAVNDEAAPSDVIQTSFPGLAAPTGEPTLSGIESAHPASGEVVQVKGPFDDRFALSSLAVQDGKVTGEITVTSDVSHLLDLQVLAGFYDATGKYLGSARFDQHTLEEPVGEEPEDHDHPVATFSVESPAEFRAKVASAAVGVPVLVNE